MLNNNGNYEIIIVILKQGLELRLREDILDDQEAVPCLLPRLQAAFSVM